MLIYSHILVYMPKSLKKCIHTRLCTQYCLMASKNLLFVK